MLLIVPAGVESATLKRFAVISWHGGAPSQAQILADRLLDTATYNSDALRGIHDLYQDQGGLVGLAPAAMLARLRLDLRNGIFLAAFFIPPENYGAYAVTAPPDMTGLEEDPSGPPANWTQTQRIAAMFRRVPGHLKGALRAQIADLFTGRALGLMALMLAALAVSQAFGVGEAVDMILVALAWRFAGWAGLLALTRLIGAIIEAANAKAEPDLQDAAKIAADAIVTMGITFVTAMLLRSRDEEHVGDTSPPPKQEPPLPKKTPATPKSPPPRTNFFQPKNVGATEPGALPMTPELKAQMETALTRGPMTAEGYPDLSATDAQTFGATPQPWTGPADGQMYRVIGADNNPNGSFWALGSPPDNEAAWRAGAAVKNDWNGDGGYVTASTAGLKGWIGPAAPQLSSDSINALPGGQPQIWIPSNSAAPSAPLPTPWNIGN